MASRKRKERSPPTLRQYSFEDCPDAKLPSCCEYEYLASSPLVRETVQRWRVGQRDPLTKAVALLFPPNIFLALEGSWWPGCPYLDSPLGEDRHPMQSPKPQPRVLADLVNPWTHLHDPARFVLVYAARGIPLPKLKKAFGEHLLHYYPKLLVKEPAEPEWRVQKRGRGSLVEQTRTDLKALTAWRLHKKFGYSASKAIALLRAHRLSTYQGERTFYRAVRRAAKKIAGLERDLIEFSKRVTA